jgi:hypothetical protein
MVVEPWIAALLPLAGIVAVAGAVVIVHIGLAETGTAVDASTAGFVDNQGAD